MNRPIRQLRFSDRQQNQQIFIHYTRALASIFPMCTYGYEADVGHPQADHVESALYNELNFFLYNNQLRICFLQFIYILLQNPCYFSLEKDKKIIFSNLFLKNC